MPNWALPRGDGDGRAARRRLDVTLPQTSYDGLKPGLDAALLRGMLRLRNVAPLVLGITIDAAGKPPGRCTRRS
jgi:hypothetical protein